MKTYRESFNGSTCHSLRYLDKHLGDIGEPLKIECYHIVSKCNRYYPQSLPNGKIRTVLTGSNGSIVLGGLSFGYSGEGCRGMTELFNKTGFDSSLIHALTEHKFSWNNWLPNNSRILLFKVTKDTVFINLKNLEKIQ